MKKVTFQVVVSLILSAFVIVLVLSSIAVSQSKRVLQREVQKELLQTSQSYANQFTIELQKQENIVSMLCISASDRFRVGKYLHDRSAFLPARESFRRLMKETMKKTSDIQSLYLTFNPKTSGGNDEIWYLRNKNGEPYQKKLDNTVSDWLVDDGSETDAYYFDAIRAGSRWSGVEYDKYLDKYSVTYSQACKDPDGKLIGVMGVDIFVNHILETVNNIQLAEGGYAFLVDANQKYITGSQSQKNFNRMKEDGLIPLDAMKANRHNAEFSNYRGEKYLSSWSGTSNGWTLVLIQEETVLMAPIHNMVRMVVLMAGLLILAMLSYSYYFFKKSLSPIAREFEEKDIIMLHQSRQARLGEMVGNIAHQWKQPLNVMSILLSVVWDDFQNNRLDEDTLKDHLDKMRGSIRSMSGTVDDFAEFLKPSRKKETFDVFSAVNVALELMEESIKINRIKVQINGKIGCLTCGYKNEFCQALFNVLNNARDAIISDGPKTRLIKIDIYTIGHGTPQKKICIDVTNTGDTIPKEVLSHVFQPYFSTKEDEGGTGIGLYLTKDIVETHMGGTIELMNVENGVLCRIIVPGERCDE